MAPQTHARLEVAREHFKQNRFAAAEAEVQSVLSEEPGNTPALTLLGVTNFKLGRLADAERALAAVHEREPKQLDAIGLLGIVRRAQGNLPGAIQLFQELLSMGHETADIYNQLGACWLELDDPIAAGGAFKRAIELDRSAAHSYYNLGMALKLAGNSFETFATFKRSTELNPAFHDNYVQLWQQMRQLLNWQEGLPLLEDGLRRHPNSTQMMVMLASTYGKIGRPDKAEALFLTAATKDPTAGPPYAHWLQEEGRFDESIPVLKNAIRLDPIQGQAYYNLAMADCFDFDGRPLHEVVSPLLENDAIGPEGRMFLYYALAKNYDQLQNYQAAMKNYDLANEHAYRLFNAGVSHEAEAVESEYATLLTLYSKDAIATLQKHGSTSSTPIFIVGMIRTGTTLLDQILSSHPLVKSAGEQPFWQVSAGRVNRRWIHSRGDANDIRDLETRYLDVLRYAGAGADRVTDKMPTNFWHMGLMSIVFPNAKFIHLRRNPLDTCLSIYTTFLGRGTQFAYNQANITNYYRAYLNVMNHWRTVVPRRQMIEIDYEDLVTNKERVLREVLEFCGLEWDVACLSHETNRAQVSTPSLWSARQPVSASSVERWRRYEPWLGRLIEVKDLKHPEPARSQNA